MALFHQPNISPGPRALLRMPPDERAKWVRTYFGRAVHGVRRTVPGMKPVRQVFFICGFPRSGTNWVCNLVNLHPQVCGTGEFHMHRLHRVISEYMEHEWEAIHNPVLKRWVDHGYREIIERVLLESSTALKPFATVLGDRSPGPLTRILPGARYLWVVRDGRDVIVSWAFHLLATPDAERRAVTPPAVARVMERQNALLSADPEYFKKHPEHLLSDRTVVSWMAAQWGYRCQVDREAFKCLGGGGADALAMEVRYERLHEDLASELAKVFRFIGVNPAKAKTPEGLTAAGFATGDARSHYRAGKAKAWGKYFTEESRSWFHDAAGKELIELGYEQDADWVIGESRPEGVSHVVQAVDL